MKKIQAFLAIALSFASSFAFAVVPIGVDTAVTAAQTDAVTVGGYLIIALAGILAVKWVMRMVGR